MIELGQLDIRAEDDVVRAHQATRTIASQLGYSTFEQTRIATAVSEIARNALTYGGGGGVTLGLDDDRTAIVISVVDHGPGIADLDAVLDGSHRSVAGLGVGLRGSRRLMDDLTVATSASGTRVEMRKRLPRGATTAAAASRGDDGIRAMRRQLAANLADEPRQAIGKLQRDVTERDQRIQELADELFETNRGVIALHAELENRADYQRQAVELRTRLVAEMGHEVRTPLHSISAISGFLADHLDGPLSPEQDKQARLIHDIADTLIAYVNDLLELARTDAGKAAVHPTRFTVDATFATLRRLIQPLVRDPRIALRFEVAPTTPALYTDEPKLAQILRNLVANALEFTERGSITVRAAPAADGRVAFEVEDTGIGIADGDHDIIFQEFAQLDGATGARVRGTGLGLPLSRRLAELLGGGLDVTSQHGVGSTFRFEILAHYPTGAPFTATELEPVVQAVPVDGARPRVLVIDDDLASRYVLRRWLDDRYDVEEAPTGADGLRLAASWQPHAIFLDVVMPDLTGFEVLDRLRAEAATRAIPVIVYSALTLGTNDRARLAGAAAILRKSTSSRVADRSAVEDALIKAGVAFLAGSKA